MPRTLYDLGTDALRLMEALEQLPDGEVPEELGLFLDEHAADVAQKLDGYLAVIGTLSMEAVAAKAEEEQWAAKRKAREKRVEFLKARLKEHLERTGQKEVRTATGRVIALQAAGGKQPLEIDGVNLDNLAITHPWLVKATLSIDKDCVRESLEAGSSISFARLLPRTTSLRIR